MAQPIRDELLISLREQGYILLAKLPATGELTGIMPFVFTFGLCVGLDETGYKTRYCYERLSDAAQALFGWDGRGDPPGPWIKQKGGGVDRGNPNLAQFKGIPIEVNSDHQGEFDATGPGAASD